MDRTKTIQIGLILLGLFVAVTGLYLQFVYYHFTTYLSLIFFVGAGIAIAGYRFPKREEIKKEREARRLERKQIPRGTGDTVALWGLGIFFVGLSVGLVAMLVHLTSLELGLITFLFIFIGFILVLVGRDYSKAEKRIKDSRLT